MISVFIYLCPFKWKYMYINFYLACIKQSYKECKAYNSNQHVCNDWGFELLITLSSATRNIFIWQVHAAYIFWQINMHVYLSNCKIFIHKSKHNWINLVISVFHSLPCIPILLAIVQVPSNRSHVWLAQNGWHKYWQFSPYELLHPEKWKDLFCVCGLT